MPVFTQPLPDLVIAGLALTSNVLLVPEDAVALQISEAVGGSIAQAFVEVEPTKTGASFVRWQAGAPPVDIFVAPGKAAQIAPMAFLQVRLRSLIAAPAAGQTFKVDAQIRN